MIACKKGLNYLYQLVATYLTHHLNMKGGMRSNEGIGLKAKQEPLTSPDVLMPKAI